MLYANDENGGRIKATPHANAFCPTCDAQMVAKCGRVVVWHWAHQSTHDCDPWSEGETIWHAAWKSRFENSEVTIRGGGADAGEYHRADAVSQSGTVIEFQHSTISAQDIERRETFYKDMVWVLDVTRAFRNNRIDLKYETPQSGRPFCKFFWSHRKRSFDESMVPVFLDLGIAFRDVGCSLHKKSRWWDDGDDGLRDGIAREAGFWQRVEIVPLLIEIKKRKEGAGWGHAITHSEFCRRFGGNCADEQPAKRGLRLEHGFESGGGCWDCGERRGGYRSFMASVRGGVSLGADYGWCERELEKGVTA